MTEFKLPSLGSDMDQGKLLQWLIKPGDTVKRGQVVAVVDTSKAAIDVEIWQEGKVHELLLQPGETVPVGTVIATLLLPGEVPPPEGVRPAAAPAARKRVSPAARKRAQELGVDLSALAGSGPDGAVTLEDVEKAASKPAAAAPDRNAAMRAAIAAAMSRSKREIPHYYLWETVPVGAAEAWLARLNEGRPVTERLLLGALQLKAVALALGKFPEINGFYRQGAFEPGSGIHIGVAISIRQGGLIAPAIHDVNKKPLPELMRDLADLVQRARAGSLRSSELSDPTVTVTNLGDQGTEAVLGVIYPPQVALIGFGRVVERPWAEAGAVKPMRVVTASLSADHRVTDGHRGALFLSHLGELLQRPAEL